MNCHFLARSSLTLLLSSALLASPSAIAKRGPIDVAKYARIAAGKCAIAKPNALEPAQEPGEMRPMVLYFVANGPRAAKLAFICVDSDTAPRTGVQIAYTAFNPKGVMPVLYGDNSRRCPTNQSEKTLPECSGTRFITGGLTLNAVVPPVTVADAYKGYGTMATVFTAFTGPDGKAREPRYYRVPVKTIPFR